MFVQAIQQYITGLRILKPVIFFILIEQTGDNKFIIQYLDRYTTDFKVKISLIYFRYRVHIAVLAHKLSCKSLHYSMFNARFPNLFDTRPWPPFLDTEHLATLNTYSFIFNMVSVTFGKLNLLNYIIFNDDLSFPSWNEKIFGLKFAAATPFLGSRDPILRVSWPPWGTGPHGLGNPDLDHSLNRTSHQYESCQCNIFSTQHGIKPDI